MNKAKITTFQDEYHVIKIHWSDVQDFYGKDDNNNGYVYGIEVNHKDNETECFWFKTEQERDMEYIERRKMSKETREKQTFVKGGITMSEVTREDKYTVILEWWMKGWQGGDFGDIMDELTGLHMGEKPLWQYDDDELDAVYKQALGELDEEQKDIDKPDTPDIDSIAETNYENRRT